MKPNITLLPVTSDILHWRRCREEEEKVNKNNNDRKRLTTTTRTRTRARKNRSLITVHFSPDSSVFAEFIVI